MNKINTLQFFCLIVLFELGSALLLDVAKDAGRDAWIVLLIGTVLGCGLFLLYVFLYQQYPTLPLTSAAQRIVGKPIGWIIGFLYCLYFLYIAARVMRDFTEMLIIVAYNETSLFTAGLLMALISIYAVHQGLKAFGRLAIICCFTIFVIIILLMLFETFSKIFHLHNLKPVLGEGFGPVLKTLFPTVLTFPFGETIAFTMIFPLLSETRHVKKAGLIAIVISGLQLALSAALHVASLGANIVERSTFPVLTSVSLINIANFITRLDAFVVVFAVIFGFFKLTIYLYCAVLGIGDLFKMKTPNKLAIPMGLIMLALSIYMAPNFTRHLEIGLKIVPFYVNIPFQIVLPILLLGIAMFKKLLKH